MVIYSDLFLQIFSWAFMKNNGCSNSYFVKCCDNDSIISEAVVHRCSIKKVFLEILQNSQENTCASVFYKNGYTALQNNFMNFILIFIRIGLVEILMQLTIKITGSRYSFYE